MDSKPCNPPHNQETGVRRPREQVYDFTWALAIVEKAIESHGRGWKIAKAILGLSNRQLATLLASADPDWPRIRYFVHWTERVLDRYARWVTPEVKVLYKSDVEVAILKGLEYAKCSESLKKYLTTRNLQQIMEEQGFEGEADTPVEASPRLLADDFAEDGSWI